MHKYLQILINSLNACPSNITYNPIHTACITKMIPLAQYQKSILSQKYKTSKSQVNSKNSHPESQSSILKQDFTYIDHYQDSDQDLVPACQKVNRIKLPPAVIENKIKNNNQRRKFIDLTDPDEDLISNSKRQKKPQKMKSASDTDPFQRLGEEVYNKVIYLFGLCEAEVDKKFPRGSNPQMDVLHKKIIKQISKYLLFGIQEYKAQDKSRYNNFSNIEMVKSAVGYAFDIQHCIWKRNSHNVKNYQNKSRMIIQNLKDFTNSELRKRVLNEEITADMLSVAHQNELLSSVKREQIEKNKKFLFVETNLYRDLPIRRAEDEKEDEPPVSNHEKTMKKLQDDQNKVAKELHQTVKDVKKSMLKIIRELPIETAEKLEAHFREQAQLYNHE